MNNALFGPQLNEIENLLISFSLLEERWWNPDTSKLIPAIFRTMNYRDVWEKHYEDKLYHFLLVDKSMLLYRYSENAGSVQINYSFLECPLNVPTYIEFLNSQGFTYEDVGHEFFPDYQLEVDSAQYKISSIPIRYDYDPIAYREGLHPVSHIHFGHSTSIRIATERILQPISFTYFIIRQYYKEKWEDFINHSDAPTKCRKIREHLDPINAKFFNIKDNWEMFFR